MIDLFVILKVSYVNLLLVHFNKTVRKRVCCKGLSLCFVLFIPLRHVFRCYHRYNYHRCETNILHSDITVNMINQEWRDRLEGTKGLYLYTFTCTYTGINESMVHIKLKGDNEINMTGGCTFSRYLKRVQHS